MAGGLKTLQHLMAANALAVVAGFACGQPVQDPTRPPETALPAPAGPAAGAAVAASGFQAIIRRAGRKPVAVINGQMVELGGKLNDATLVKLSETEAVLQGPSGKEVLRLTPAAEKKPEQKGKPGVAKAPRQAVSKQADHDK